MRKAFLLTAVLVVGCGGSGDDDDDGPDATPGIDATPVNRTDHTYIVHTVGLPATTEDVDATAFEWPNSTYPVNQMGGAITVLLGLATGIDVQGNVNAGFRDRGQWLLYSINSGDLDGRDTGVTIRIAWVVDADGNPDNDFDGTGQVRLADGEQLQIANDTVTLEDGMLEGHGSGEQSVAYPMYLLEPTEPPWNAPGVYAYIRVAIDEDGFSGAFANATTQAQLESDGYPGLAALCTRTLELGTPNADQVAAIFDANDDGEVTVEEITTNDTMASLTSPDLDLDGDEVNDHVSQGVFIEAVKVELVP